ncbi:hypothetical protein [Alkalihalobacterium elongatum]|uniref:hypothetical protein n=1 Tax=Alkalihalobacterium elongatum TaxID=2675466 RepID=UPI001C1F6F1E|nr:hypothetical protein [Alkalihalobacterium elongatum]
MKMDRRFYVSGHTRVGYFSVLPELSQQFECLFVLKGLSMKQGHETLEKIGKAIKQKHYSIDHFHSPSNNDYVEGLRIPELKIAVVTYGMIKNINAKLSEQTVIIINFEKALDEQKAAQFQKQIKQLENERDYQIQLAYERFSQAKEHHEMKEQIYLSAMDFNKANEVTDKLKKAIYQSRQGKKKVGSREEIFFGAATPKGAVHFIEELTANLKTRYIIKGRSGSGKSTLMRKIANEAHQRGMDVTYFLCGFDPSSVDMIIVEDLKIAILDGTAPHVIDPKSERDKVIDMFEFCIDPSIEETDMPAINQCDINYKGCMKEGTAHLRKAKEAQDVIDEYYDLMIVKEKLLAIQEDTIQKIIEPLQES